MDAKHTLGEPRVLVSRAALLHNAGLVRRAVGPHVKICAVVKADAYGHGAEIVADTLCNFGTENGTADGLGATGVDRPAVDALAVASFEEADALPVLGVPVIVLRPVENTFVGRQRLKLEAAVRAGWVVTVCSTAAADDVARVAVACAGRASVQVMVDTGMTRSGVRADGVAELLRKIASRPSLRLAGICTHFSNAEDPASLATGEQLRLFRACSDDCAAALGGKIVRHAANSAAAFV